MTPLQMKMARAALDMSVEQLSQLSGSSASDLARWESGGPLEPASRARLSTALERAGIEWLGDDGVRYRGAPGQDTIPVEKLNSYNDE